MHRLINNFDAACFSYDSPLLCADVNGIFGQGTGSLGHLHLDSDGITLSVFNSHCCSKNIFIKQKITNSQPYDMITKLMTSDCSE